MCTFLGYCLSLSMVYNVFGSPRFHSCLFFILGVPAPPPIYWFSSTYQAFTYLFVLMKYGNDGCCKLIFLIYTSVITCTFINIKFSITKRKQYIHNIHVSKHMQVFVHRLAYINTPPSQPNSKEIKGKGLAPPSVAVSFVPIGLNYSQL